MPALDDLIAAATTQTGLEDFGEDSFREGLEILVRSLRTEARLNSTGEAVIYLRLGVLPNQVVDSADGWATDGRVVPVMVVHVEPLVEGTGPCCL